MPLTSMRIFDEIAELYAQVPGKSFVQDFTHYLEHGYVFSGPNYFLLAQDTGTAWHIYLAAGEGSLEAFARLMPHWRPKVSWSREQRGRGTVEYDTVTLLKTIGVTDEDTAMLQKRH